MGKANNFSVGKLLLQIAVGAMLTVAGIWALQGGGDAGVAAIRSIIGDRSIENRLDYNRSQNKAAGKENR